MKKYSILLSVIIFNLLLIKFDKIMKRKITFKRDELTLVGNLFTPENFDEKSHYKAIIVQGSATSVKEQMPELYVYYCFLVL